MVMPVQLNYLQWVATPLWRPVPQTVYSDIASAISISSTHIQLPFSASVHNIVRHCYKATSATKTCLPLQPMDTEDVSQLRPKSSRAPPLSPESECFVHLLVLLFLIDGGELEQV